MARKSPTLHGNAPDKCPVALLLIDVINDLAFEGNEEIVQTAPEMAQRVAVLKNRAKALRIPCVYVNDNFGRWRSDFEKQVEHCLNDDVPGRPLVELLRPEPEDYCILKPKHSGFFSTTLDLLLRHLESQTLILTGIAGDRCVLFTANDAYLRDYKLYVPADCCVSNSRRDNDQALELMKRVLAANTEPAHSLQLEKLLQSPRK
jgi:nicotinamidase-related amidase